MLPEQEHLFDCTRSKPSQGGFRRIEPWRVMLAFVFTARWDRAWCCVDPLRPPDKSSTLLSAPAIPCHLINKNYTSDDVAFYNWAMGHPPNPFKIGDKVVFSPDARTVGWTWSSFDRLRIQPGDLGTVTKIVIDMLFIDDGRGGFSWECFRPAD
jgi:hypothetical protein